jgi:transposase InsO family protein
VAFGHITVRDLEPDHGRLLRDAGASQSAMASSTDRFLMCYGTEFCGTERHPYELYLDLNGIEHRRTRVKSPKTNGFVERFNGIVLDEFYRVKMRETFYEIIDVLQADLDAWLVHYNTERSHPGYRNQTDGPAKPSCHSPVKKVK